MAIDCPPGQIFNEKTYKCIFAPSKCTPARLAPPEDANVNYKGKKSPYIGICKGKTRQNETATVTCFVNQDRKSKSPD